MRVNEVSANSFDGKIKFDKRMSKSLVKYVNRVLDHPVNGVSAREKIAKKSYDVGVYNMSSKKAIHPKLGFITSFKVDGDDKYFRNVIKINTPIIFAANEMARYIKWVDGNKEMLNGYNNFFEAIASKWRSYFGKK